MESTHYELEDIWSQFEDLPPTLGELLWSDAYQTALDQYPCDDCRVAEHIGEGHGLPTDYASNPELAVYQQRVRSLKHGTETSLTPRQWADILDAFNRACVYCGSFADLSMDHVVPVTKRGSTTKRNIVPACRRCNSSKNDADLVDWAARVGLDIDAIFDRIDTARRRMRPTP